MAAAHQSTGLSWGARQQHTRAQALQWEHSDDTRAHALLLGAWEQRPLRGKHSNRTQERRPYTGGHQQNTGAQGLHRETSAEHRSAGRTRGDSSRKQEHRAYTGGHQQNTGAQALHEGTAAEHRSAGLTRGDSSRTQECRPYTGGQQQNTGA
ncbi:hypothetical protein NDU88_001579 [Pleurodeles waltl]|uniref:Uncharacterized protein n=1 Tax=Pleurodeles waltl TaxID=8319 RepID=A0AAV7P4M0_PLEWA|nr:hypothetical protein NDU88_001579 [Pleurodeles waltl]